MGVRESLQIRLRLWYCHIFYFVFMMLCLCLVIWTSKCALLIYTILHYDGYFVIENPMTSLVWSLFVSGHICKWFSVHHRFDVFALRWPDAWSLFLFWTELASHPRLAHLFAVCPIQTAFTWLGEYGSGTPKPIRFWSNCQLIHSLRRTVLWGYLQVVDSPANDGYHGTNPGGD